MKFQRSLFQSQLSKVLARIELKGFELRYRDWKLPRGTGKVHSDGSNLKEFLVSRKKLFIDNISDIDDLLTYHEDAYVLSKEDLERIRCSLDRKGNRWAINEFLDCLKTKGNRGFQTFMVFLQNQNLTEPEPYSNKGVTSYL